MISLLPNQRLEVVPSGAIALKFQAVTSELLDYTETRERIATVTGYETSTSAAARVLAPTIVGGTRVVQSFQVAPVNSALSTTLTLQLVTVPTPLVGVTQAETVQTLDIISLSAGYVLLMEGGDAGWSVRIPAASTVIPAVGAEGTVLRVVSGAATWASLDSVYQPLDADLTAIAALTTTTFGRSLLTQADAPTTRTTLGLGTSDSPTFAGVNISSGSSKSIQLRQNNNVSAIDIFSVDGVANKRRMSVLPFVSAGVSRLEFQRINDAGSYLGSLAGFDLEGTGTAMAVNGLYLGSTLPTDAVAGNGLIQRAPGTTKANGDAYGTDCFFYRTGTGMAIESPDAQLKLTNGGSNVKWLRVSVNQLQVLSSSYANIIFSVDDSGTTSIGQSTSSIHGITGATQATVGAAGGASALPATPVGYLRLSINGTTRKIPYYND